MLCTDPDALIDYDHLPRYSEKQGIAFEKDWRDAIANQNFDELQLMYDENVIAFDTLLTKDDAIRRSLRMVPPGTFKKEQVHGLQIERTNSNSRRAEKMWVSHVYSTEYLQRIAEFNLKLRWTGKKYVIYQIDDRISYHIEYTKRKIPDNNIRFKAVPDSFVVTGENFGEPGTSNIDILSAVVKPTLKRVTWNDTSSFPIKAYLHGPLYLLATNIKENKTTQMLKIDYRCDVGDNLQGFPLTGTDYGQVSFKRRDSLGRHLGSVSLYDEWYVDSCSVPQPNPFMNSLSDFQYKKHFPAYPDSLYGISDYIIRNGRTMSLTTLYRVVGDTNKRIVQIPWIINGERTIYWMPNICLHNLPSDQSTPIAWTIPIDKEGRLWAEYKFRYNREKLRFEGSKKIIKK